MDVNLSLRLQRRVACDQSFNISCLLGRIQYDVGYLTIEDKCFIEHVEGKSVWNNTYDSILQKYYICIFLLTRAKLSKACIYFMSCRTPKVILMFVKLFCIFYRVRGNIDSEFIPTLYKFLLSTYRKCSVRNILPCRESRPMTEPETYSCY